MTNLLCRCGTGLILMLTCILLQAQPPIELPRKSNRAAIEYTVGLTDIRITYSSPKVQNRQIWGNLVPYGEVWRAGANEATTIEFSTNVNIEGKMLPKGRYSFFIIPRKTEEWTIVFNKVADQWGTYEYESKEDIIRIDIEPAQRKVSEEHLSYQIVAHSINSGYIRFAWEKKRLYIRFKVNVMDQAMARITDALDMAEESDKWQLYAVGADFLLNNDHELKQAMKWINASTGAFDHSWNHWIKAQLLARNENFAKALQEASLSRELGVKEQDGYYQSIVEDLERAIARWEQKRP